MSDFARYDVPRPRRPLQRPFSIAWLLVCLGIAAGVYVLGTPFFKELAIDHPGQIDGILLLVVFLVGGLMAGTWLFIDQGGGHNIKWYLVGAAVLAAALVGVQQGKQAETDKQSPGMFREAEPARLPER
jgi:uncharacterized membrane protein